MKYSFMTLCALGMPELSAANLIDIARDCGFDGIDYTNRLHEIVSPHDFRERAEDAGLPVVCNIFCNNLFAPGRSFDDWLDDMYRAAEETRELQCRYTLIPTPGIPGVDRAQTRRRWTEALDRAIRHTRGSETVFLIESFAASGPASCFITADDLLEAVEGASGLELNFDNGNMAPLQDPVEGFRQCAQYVRRAHFKDWHIFAEAAPGRLEVPGGKFYAVAEPGTGDLEFAPLIEVMREQGFDGYTNLEYFSPDRDVLKRVLDRLRALE